MPQLGDRIKASELGLKGKNNYIWVECPSCKKGRWVSCSNREGMCKSCALKLNWQQGIYHGKQLRGNKNSNWKGGRTKHKAGYIMVRLQPDDFFFPMAAKSRNYVMEHRLVVAKVLGRCLLPWEVVHHKEGFAKDDNRYPETLELLPNPYKHDTLTKMAGYIRKLEKRIKELEVCVKKL